jgi:hypothetical protein
MYALHDTGLVVHALPPPQSFNPTGQPPERTVEAAEHGSLETEDHLGARYDPTTAVLQLVENTAQRFAELLEDADRRTDAGQPGGGPPEDVAFGQNVDLYA